MTYGNEKGLLRLVFDIWECKSEVVKSSSNIYIYEKEKQAGKLPLEFPWNLQPLDLHRTVERGGHRAVEIK